MTQLPDIWEYADNFNYDQPLGPDDEFLVDMQAGRKDFSRERIFRALGMNAATREIRTAKKTSQYLLFGGHRGCGKSTELRQIAANLKGPKGFLVVFIDAVKDLDINNITYSDIALAQAQALVEQLQQHKLDVPELITQPLIDWFEERVTRVERNTSISSKVETGAKAETGLPYIGKLFASFTAAISNNTSYKEEIRREVKDAFSTFATHMNKLLGYVRDKIQQQGIAQSIVFIVDGTDRLSGDNAKALFLTDIHQLRLINANFVYCAPIHILSEEGQVSQNFDNTFRLPMIKLSEKHSDNRHEEAWQVMRQMLEKRIPLEVFACTKTIDTLIAGSGGHSRDLIRLINLCMQELDAAPITLDIAQTAVKRLGKEYSRVIQQEDYAILKSIDQGPTEDTPVNEATRRLLYDLVLLEYNDYWWQSHPAVRTLPAYRAD